MTKFALPYQSSRGKTLRCLLRITVCVFVMLPNQQASAQSKSAGIEATSLCNRDNAVESIKQQVAITRTFDNAVRRIAVLNRAADLLWPFEQDKARGAFTEAFDVAVQADKEEHSKDQPRSLIKEMQTPDQRYVVIRAVAKRDAAWAKKLTQQVLKLERQRRDEDSKKDSFNDVLTAQRLLDSANQLLAIDFNAALDLARASLNYPASFMITNFLYKVSAVNQQTADQFYEQALAVYADRPMREFLYLSTYPFAFQEDGDMPVFGAYVVPANFVTNSSLQRKFVLNLLRHAQKALEIPLDEADNFNNFPGNGHILQQLIRIEPHIRGPLHDLSGAVIQAREKILVSLSVENQKMFLRSGRNEVASSPAKTFDEQVETAEKTPNVDNRDELITTAVLSSAGKKDLISVVNAINKINDSGARASLLEWVYFNRVKDATQDKRFEEAKRLVARVEGREQRAYLLTEIAKGLLNTAETQAQVREALDEAIIEAHKAGPTIFAARTLLLASSLYARIDTARSISVLGDAINSINRIETPDFSVGDQTLMKEIKTKSFRRVLWFHMPGLDPESALREMAKIDFDGASYQTNSFTDTFQRTVTTLALAEFCLQQAQQSPQGAKR